MNVIFRKGFKSTCPNCDEYTIEIIKNLCDGDALNEKVISSIDFGEYKKGDCFVCKRCGTPFVQTVPVIGGATRLHIYCDDGWVESG